MAMGKTTTAGEAGVDVCGDQRPAAERRASVYTRLNQIQDFDGYVEGLCQRFYAEEGPAASISDSSYGSLKSDRVFCSADGSPLTQRLVQGLVTRAARRARLRNVGVHILRHTFCSQLAMRGAGARAIQELAGHRDLSTTQRYMHVSPAAVASAIW